MIAQPHAREVLAGGRHHGDIIEDGFAGGKLHSQSDSAIKL